MTPEHQPVTRQDLEEAEQQTVDRLTEVMRTMQSEILRGLEAFARGNFARMHRLDASDADTNIA